MELINTTSDSYSLENKNGLSSDSLHINEESHINLSKPKEKINICPENKKKKKIVCSYCDSMDILILSVNIIIMLLYIGSLIPCGAFKGAYKCVWFFNKDFFSLIGGKIFVSALLTSFLLCCFIYYRKYYWHCSYMIAFYLLFFICIDGTTRPFHGVYNTFLFLLFFSVFMSIFGIGFLIRWLYQKKHFLFLYLFSLAIIIAYILYHNNKIFNFSCEFWDYGLNNTKINNIDKNYPCKIEIPQKNQCYMTAFNGWFDWSNMLNMKCDTPRVRRKQYRVFRNYLNDTMKRKMHFGFPITTTSHYLNINYTVRFKELIKRNIIDMEKYNKGLYPSDLPRPEVELIFDNKTKLGSYNITVRKNETLIKERREMSKKSTSMYNNVLIIYLDAVSRPNFFRKLIKTSKFLEKFVRYDENANTKDFSVFQFLKYHTLKPQTVYNIKPMFYGVHYYDINGTNIVKYYREQGFVTGHTGTTCGKEIFQADQEDKYINSLNYDYFDHENVAMFCDRNFQQKYGKLSGGHNSQVLRCLHGKKNFEHAMEYTEKFWNTYINEKKFFRIHINEGHDGSNSLINNLDDYLYEFILKFYTNGWLKDTFVMIASDHGTQLPGPWTLIGSQDYMIERTLGTLFFMIPNDERLYKNNLYNDIAYNQQMFITPFDIHDTLVQIAVGDNKDYQFAYSKRGQSLLKVINDIDDRYCESKKFRYRIQSYDCQCH